MDVEGVIVGPTVVGLPGIVTALEKDVCRSIIANDEDDVALPTGGASPFRQQGEPAEVDTAGPIGGNLQLARRFPFTLAKPAVADGRIGLHCPLEGPQGRHQPGTFSPVVSHAENLDLKLFRRVGAHHDVERLTRFDALVRAISLDQGGPEPVPRVLDASQLPVGAAW